jgi:hypothetical protein
MQALQKFLEPVIENREAVVAFGLILYTDEHPHVKKVLRDKDYWQALDKMSGQRWAILAARAVRGHYELPDMPPGMMGMMRMVWHEPEQNRQLLATFGLEDTARLPMFVLFTPLHDGRLLHTSIKLNDESEEAAFARLKDVVSALTEAVNVIQKENREDYEAVFNALKMAVFDIKVRDFVKSGMGLYSWVKDKWPA